MNISEYILTNPLLLIPMAAMVWLAIFIIKLICDWIASLRDELRGRYTSDRWKAAGIDWVMMPLWIVLEIVCFIGLIIAAIFTIVLAYQAATAARDWWHAGNHK